MRILDLSAGNRAIWYNKNHPFAIYLDKRAEVKPTVVANSTKIPKKIGKNFDLVVFDPPHLNVGASSHMAKRYGHSTTKEILETIEGTGREAHRVTRENALMALKWNDHSIRLQRVFDLLPNWEPLFGHLTKNGSTSSSQTFWVLLRRMDGA